MLIPKELQSTENLNEAIFNLSGDIRVKKYHFELKVLEKKVRYVNQLVKKNLKAANQKKMTFFHHVSPLICYYKGLGIFNNGRMIPKGKFIGKFLG